MLLSLISTVYAQTNLGTFEGPTPEFNPGTDEKVAATILETIISNAIGLLTIIAGIFFIIQFVLAAFNWLSAGGDTGKVQKARDSIIQALIGIIILVAAYAVAGLVGSVVGINILRPGEMILNLAP